MYHHLVLFTACIYLRYAALVSSFRLHELDKLGKVSELVHGWLEAHDTTFFRVPRHLWNGELRHRA